MPITFKPHLNRYFALPFRNQPHFVFSVGLLVPQNNTCSICSNEFFFFIMQETDRKGFREFLRMSVEDFQLLLGKVEPLIKKTDTKMRRAISARQRLSLTLRFLATGRPKLNDFEQNDVLLNLIIYTRNLFAFLGESFRSLSFQYRIGRSTVGLIVMETCQALYNVLKEDHMKVL